MSWEIQGNKLVGTADAQYELHPQEFWYVVPTRTHYSRNDRQKVRPLEFAFVLHSARISCGLVISAAQMKHGMKPKTLKGGVAAEAEDLLESVRRTHFPTFPSRLECYFLNQDREVAEYRMRDTLRGNNTLVRCRIVLNGATLHFADSRVYERLEGSPDNTVAMAYWRRFDPKTDEERRNLEILADAQLFFPDWRTFPTLSVESLLEWQQDNPPG